MLLGIVDYVGLGVTNGQFLGVFKIPPLVNLVYVLTGLHGLILRRYSGGGTLFNKVGGVIYLVIFLLGVVAVVVGAGSINWATNGLQLLLGVVVAGVGFGIDNPRPR